MLLLSLVIIIIIIIIFCNCLIDAQVGQAELYIRLVNSRDVTSQDALNAQPIQHYMYKYPALVSGHSRCKGQAKLVKKYAVCRQEHLKEKTQFFRLFLEGRVVGGRSSSTISYNALECETAFLAFCFLFAKSPETFWSFSSIALL